MKTLYFEDVEDFIIQVIDDLDTFADEDGYSSVGIIAKYEQAKEVIQEAVSFGFDIKNIELEEPKIDWYDKEFAITLTSNGEIWCQKMWYPDNEFHEAGYICGEDNVTYIHSDCNSKALENYDMDNDVIVEFSIDEDEDCDIDCCDCYGNGVCEKTKDDVATTSYSVNGKSVSKEEYENKMAEFDKVYRKNLLDMCEMMDEMNEWRKLLRW